jgi:hypothetical protein
MDFAKEFLLVAGGSACKDQFNADLLAFLRGQE